MRTADNRATRENEPLLSAAGNDPFVYTGLERDPENSSDHAWFRNYASAQMRWLRSDPDDGSYNLMNPQSLNRYAYVLNNPLAAIDPTGLELVVTCDDSGNCTTWDDGGGDGGGGAGDSGGVAVLMVQVARATYACTPVQVRTFRIRRRHSRQLRRPIHRSPRPHLGGRRSALGSRPR